MLNDEPKFFFLKNFGPYDFLFKNVNNYFRAVKSRNHY